MTTTSTAPAAWLGVVPVIVVALTTVTDVNVLPPKVTVAPDWKLVPVSVTLAPPRVEPLAGVTELAAGGATYVNRSPGFAALDCPLTVTMTSATPAGCAGVVALICVALTTLTPVAALPPTVTVAVASKLVPVMVIAVPPVVGPEVGLTAPTVGGGGARYVNWSLGSVALDCPPIVTTTSATPATWPGVVALIWVALTTLTPVATLPPTEIGRASCRERV